MLRNVQAVEVLEEPEVLEGGAQILMATASVCLSDHKGGWQEPRQGRQQQCHLLGGGKGSWRLQK